MKHSYRNAVFYEDLQYIYDQLDEEEKKKLNGSSLLITGCAGFLGFYLMHFLQHYSTQLGIQKVIGIDNFKLGVPSWLEGIESEKIEIHNVDIASLSVSNSILEQNIDYIIHMASIASPSYYRKFPIETIDANVWGIRTLLDYYKQLPIKGFLFFSSSEIYGDPPSECIPTPETYRGNVEINGPRSCYDEAKRFSETLCYNYSMQFDMPISIVRPFNNYGPGMKLTDKRVPADFAKSVFENKPINIFSDGTPTRTFCYVTDAIVGYLKALLYEPFEFFNIGIAEPEISVKELAQLYQKAGDSLFGYSLPIKYRLPKEKMYLTDNPSRRCPDISKAKSLLNFNPSIRVENGVLRFLTFIHQGGISK